MTEPDNPRIIALENQRDALLAALKKILTIPDRAPDSTGDMWRRRIDQIANAAIKQAESIDATEADVADSAAGAASPAKQPERFGA